MSIHSLLERFIQTKAALWFYNKKSSQHIHANRIKNIHEIMKSNMRKTTHFYLKSL